MSAFSEKVTQFKQKQKDIVALKEALDSKFAELEAKRDAFLQALDSEIQPVRSAYEDAKEKYKAETKAWLGIADGEVINIVEVAEMVKKIQGLE